MLAIGLAVILAFVVQLVVWEAVVLGGTWLVNTVADTTISYLLVGGIVLGIWALITLVKGLFIYGSYKETTKYGRGR